MPQETNPQPNDSTIVLGGHTYTHRDPNSGRLARIVSTNGCGELSVIAIILHEGGKERCYLPDTFLSFVHWFHYGTPDLVKGALPSTDWAQVAVGTPVIVWDEDQRYPKKRYFSGILNDPFLILTFINGSTEWSCPVGGEAESWSNGVLASDYEELKKKED